METAVELWNCLRRVRSLRFVADSARATGWHGVGTGSVVVDSSTDSVLTFYGVRLLAAQRRTSAAVQQCLPVVADQREFDPP